MSTFVYVGVFAEKKTPNIGVVAWPNGCRHLIGGVRLAFDTASPRLYWRRAATHAAKQIVAAVGGYAWDVRGEVSVVVPRSRAWEVMRLMEDVGEVEVGFEGTSAPYRRRNRVRLFNAGLARITHGYGFDFVPVVDPLPEEPLKAALSNGEVIFTDSRGTVGTARWTGQLPVSIYPEPESVYPEPEPKPEPKPEAEATARGPAGR